MLEPANSHSIDGFNAMDEEAARAALIECCTSTTWVEQVLAGRPYGSAEDLMVVADQSLAGLDLHEIAAALDGHPRIGESASGPGAASSELEQAGMADAEATTRAALDEGNRAYEERFGHIYVVSALDRTADELLAMLRRRLRNNNATEARETKAQLRVINRLRLGRMLDSASD